MNATFFIHKMPTKLADSKVEYFFHNGCESFIQMNDLIGSKIKIEFTGRLQCIDCQKIVKKFYAPGLCYICMQSSALNSPCIMNPELCEAHLGLGKVPEWEIEHHNQPHIVYLANSGGLKVGVTRTDQIPTRWIDQGADEAIILVLTPYRQLAGMIEVALKDHLNDKTNWRQMLKNIKDTSVSLSLAKEKYSEVLFSIDENFGDYISEDDTVYQLNYPAQIIENPINSLKLDKKPIIEGELTGIKGQYLILDNKEVINMRSHSGYEINLLSNSN